MSGLFARQRTRERLGDRLDDIRPRLGGRDRDNDAAPADPADAAPRPRGRDTVLTRRGLPQYGARRTAIGGAPQ